MEIIKVKLKDIKPYKNNAKKHPKEQIEQIKQSIVEFENNDPIAIDENNVIIEGHGRYQALKELGYKEAECIRLEHLTEEQKRAYMLVHNKLTMNSDFDYELLDFEMGEIFSVDMEQFGFEFFDPVEEKQKNAETTQQRVANILNLEHAQFEGAGKYDIPEIEPVYDLPEIKEWIGFNYVLSDDEPEGKAVHFFIDDYQFERVWNNPEAYMDKLRRYACVLSPDFSPYGNMPLATQIFNHYRKHWCGAYMQENGVTVIPTIRCSTDERSLEFYLEGEPKGGIVAYSSMWIKEGNRNYDIAKKEWDGMIKTLKPSKVLVYGKVFDFMEGIEIENIAQFTDKWRK